MADNTRLNPGVDGDLMRSIEKGAAKTQVVVLDLGGSGAESLASGAIPVTLTSTTITGNVAVTGPLTDAQLRSSAVPVSGPLTDAQLRASAVPVSGTFFQATQPVSFTWAGLTDAELRATAVPVSAASLPLPAGAAVAQTIGIPPNDKAVCSFPIGIAFTTAISRSIVTGSADNDATAVTAGDVVGDIFFA